MHYSRKLLHSSLLLFLLCVPLSAQQPEQTERKINNPISVAEEEQRAKRKLPQQVSVTVQVPVGRQDELTVDARNQEGGDNVLIASGDVVMEGAGILAKADRITWNKITNDVLAEGNVYLEQQGQKLTGERLELNLRTRRGTIYAAKGMTNRTPDGTTLIIKASRADKTGLDTYNLTAAELTACEEPNPKWSFTTSRARIRQDDRATLYNPVFRIKGIPVLYLPYLSLSISKKDRSSGFLLPGSGASNIKGRTLHMAYFQTLGRSADILFRTDVFTKRGIGTGLDFRARPNENSRIALGSFIVFDRVLGQKRDAAGNKLPNQGGSSFYADAVQYFKNGFMAVADVNITSSFDFRQVFAENALQAISPEERSQFYLNRNWHQYSLNIMLNEQTTFIRDRNEQNPAFTDKIVRVRQLPSFSFTRRSSRLSEKIPFYLSFDAALEGVRRSEASSGVSFLNAPSIIQRMDLAPRLTFPLKSFAGGFTLTPSLGFRSTFYSSSFDPTKREFISRNLLRNYAEVEMDLRPPSLAKVFRHRNGSPWFRHIIEPFLTYRRIAGIDEFRQTPRIDERDVIASTNELEYGISNRFFVRRVGADGKTSQAYELLDVTLTQKYFFDPAFGGALQDCGTGNLPDCRREQFFPLNTLSGFSYGGIRRNISPLSVRARVRPSPLTFADVRLNYDTRFQEIREFIVGGGYSKGAVTISQSWYFTRRIATDQLRFDPSSLPGNQFDVAAFLGNVQRGPYGGLSVAYDFRNRTLTGVARDPQLIYLISTAGWAWDCCSLQAQNFTLKAGFRNENRVVFAFTLKGIGTFGTENIGQRRRLGF
jgi:LPS-assembly protein